MGQALCLRGTLSPALRSSESARPPPDARVKSIEERATPKPVRKVFLSSTGADLRTYREAAYAALHKLDGWHCIRMEDFGARDRDMDTFIPRRVWTRPRRSARQEIPG